MSKGFIYFWHNGQRIKVGSHKEFCYKRNAHLSGWEVVCCRYEPTALSMAGAIVAQAILVDDFVDVEEELKKALNESYNKVVAFGATEVYQLDDTIIDSIKAIVEFESGQVDWI